MKHLMRKLLLMTTSTLLLCSCASSSSITSSSSTIKSSQSNVVDEDDDMTLKIDDKEIDVTWLNNDSVKALKKILPLTINMHEYGGFEQTGSIGQSIVRNDSQIDVVPGDIVLYSGSAISVFYSTSSWSYTRLGHINLNKNELNALLNKESVTFVLKGE